MEIISKSNMGFRVRPSFQKIANKPNKDINYVVNPRQVVRDSFEFSNLINSEIDIEDEIKNDITDEIYHEEVQKEIGRRKTLEKDRETKTTDDLGGVIPTTLPEMSATMRTSPESATPVIPTTPTAVPEVFTFASSSTDKTAPRVKRPVRAKSNKQVEPTETLPKSKTVNKPEVFNIASDSDDKTPTQQTRRLVRAKQRMQVDTANVIPAKTMDTDTEGVKRGAESTDERIKKAARGNQVVSNFPALLDDKRITVPMIQQQMIMHNVDFDPAATKTELALVISKKTLG